ncbi:MAG: phage portal protein [Planctomycetes bacterium]|nr:phage portal protein [Planctomycetota bacterium]
MKLDFANFGDPNLDEAFVEHLVRDGSPGRAAHFNRLWAYYRNDLSPLGAGLPFAERDRDWLASAKPYTQAQEFGLPARITGCSHLGLGGAGVPQPGLSRKEVVIENDIAWRIDTGIHFLAGNPVGMESLARRSEDARRIEAVLSAVWNASGGISLLQEIALLGAVYGFVDLVIRARPPADAPTDSAAAADTQAAPIDRAREAVAVEAVEAPRILPILDETDYRRVRYWVQVFYSQTNRMTGGGPVARLLGRGPHPAAEVEVVEILGPRWWQRYEDGHLADEGANPLGRLPVVHVQNFANPMHYEGTSDVEPLIPLQDELNTRLSDRANRVTFQSFKMYLGRGIEAFEDRPVAPGRMWSTDNPDASIQAFGGDADSPSETAHIAELREALDKTSGITPLAAGLLRDRLGNLTSAAALKVVLMGTLARLARKRITYGAGLVEANRLILKALDAFGVLKTAPEDRATRLHWPDPLPENLAQRLAEAKAKRDLGVPAGTVLRELGYEPNAT